MLAYIFNSTESKTDIRIYKDAHVVVMPIGAHKQSFLCWILAQYLTTTHKERTICVLSKACRRVKGALTTLTKSRCVPPQRLFYWSLVFSIFILISLSSSDEYNMLNVVFAKTSQFILSLTPQTELLFGNV